MSYTIKQIEDAVITALEPMKGTHSVRTIATYHGDLDGPDVKKIAARLPAIWVIYGGGQYAEHGARKVETMRFTLIVCDRSLSAEADARRGGASGNPGAYDMLDEIRDLLCGKRLSLGIFPISLVEEAPLWFESGIAVYGATYETAQSLLYASE